MIHAFRDIALVLAIVVVALIIIVRLDDAPIDERSGSVRVVDGDTLVLDSERIRLAGIDAPELGQTCQRISRIWPCGLDAKTQLHMLIGEAQTHCRIHDRDRYNRLLAVCTTGARNLNAAMVETGFAIAFGNYETEEEDARRRHAGLWSGTFERPQHWRRTHRIVEEPRPVAPIGTFLRFLQDMM